jgi:hypothetical protein
MKLTVFVIALVATVSAAEGAEQCRFIEARADRDACYQRQDAERLARQKANEARQAEQPKPYEPMTADDAQLAKAMRGICRGC